MSRTLAVFCVLLTVLPAVPAQPIQPAQPEQPGPLEISCLRGGNAIHLIPSGRIERPRVAVLLAGRPVNGATVTFELPETGPSGTFLRTEAGLTKKASSISVQTNKKGEASANGFEPNTTEGAYVMKVTAQHQSASATAEISQCNVRMSADAEARQKLKSRTWMIVVIAAIGVLVAGAVIARTID